MQQAITSELSGEVVTNSNDIITECANKMPLWKKLFSYFYTFKVECASSSINPRLDVVMKQGRYQLCTPNAIYSYGDLYDNFTRSFDAIELDLLDVKKVLVLGFGLGSVPTILEKVFEKQYDYTGVEIDCKVIDLAKKYVLPEIKSTISLICDDAQHFVGSCKEKFDLVAIDLFIDDKIPSVFEQSDFLRQIQNLLSPDGIVLYNRLTDNKKDLLNTQLFYQERFQGTFPDATYLDVDGNWMLLNRKDILRS